MNAVLVEQVAATQGQARLALCQRLQADAARVGARRRVLLDAGTSLIYFPRQAYSEFRTVFNMQVPQPSPSVIIS